MKKIFLFLILLVFISGCRNTDQIDSSGDIKEFVMIAKQFDFEPSSIVVNKGDRVRLKITAIDVKHGFSLSKFGINRDLEVDKEEVIEFVADEEGEFKFRCSVFCGSGHGGMEGVLVVNG